MPTKSSDSLRRRWNAEHAVLRRLLEKGHDLPQALATFEPHHAAVHSAPLDPGCGWSFQDEVLDQLTPAQMRARPPGQAHSVAWLIWHITRIEDAAMNTILTGTPDVFFSGNWAARLQTRYIDTGNAMPAEDIARLSETLNLKALLAYRLAVGQHTRAIVRRLAPERLAARPLPARLQQLADTGVVRAEAAEVLAYWGSHRATNLLLMPAARHAFVHLNEIRRLRPKLRPFA